MVNWSSRPASTTFVRAARSKLASWKKSAAIRPPRGNWSGSKGPRHDVAALSRAGLAAPAAIPQSDEAGRQAQRRGDADLHGDCDPGLGRLVFRGAGIGHSLPAPGHARLFPVI